MDDIEYWKLSDHLSVVQATLLIIGENPGDGSEDYVLGWNPENRPKGFNAVFSSLKNAVINNKIKANIIRSVQTVYRCNMDGEEWDEEIPDKEPDWRLTTILADDLKNWLKNRNIYPAFFFSDNTDNRDYLDKNHPHYSPKLAMTIKAWEAIKNNPQLLNRKTPKQALEKQLREIAPLYGFTDENGLPQTQPIEDMAKVGNWNIKGGVAKAYTPPSNANPPPNQNIENNEEFDDSNIPF